MVVWDGVKNARWGEAAAGAATIALNPTGSRENALGLEYDTVYHEASRATARRSATPPA